MTEEELNLDKNKFFLDKAFTLIADKEKIMTLIIQLMVALLIISSFSNNFIEDNGVIKNIIIFLLILIPIML